MTNSENDVAFLLKAPNYSAQKHTHQRRKDEDQSPYINHPIQVAEMISRVGRVKDIDVLVAAILHDTIEDTNATYADIEHEFGKKIANIVQEVTDDKNLPKETRKQLQIEHAPHLSAEAKLVKLGDKICNITDICSHPPAAWPIERRQDYLTWAECVVAGLRGANSELEGEFDRHLQAGRAALSTTTEI
jgi:GTP diphosphokinase / guanosine-3',5'-bis(diphosphate) 3'-diphosphatase